ncbi:MAG: hypothetical protein PHZ00_04645 [Candidatus Peribacteraceae bacterium]|nr:hypothetical protein [Candidatus Peribacteraceae bacterium]
MMLGSTVLLLVVIGTLIIGLALLILFHNNLNATKGYKLRSLEHTRAGLMRDQEDLNMLIADSQSLRSLQSDVQVQAMVKAAKVKYVEGEPAIAMAPEGEGQ